MKIFYDKIVITIVLMFILLFASDLQAQDPSFSQFYAARTYLNPAFTGIEPGVTVSTTMRDQWRGAGESFRTYYASIELQEPAFNSGIGITIMKDQSGAAALTTDNLGIAYSYSPGLENGSLHIGFRTGWVRKYLDWDRLIFPDQIDNPMGEMTTNTIAQNPNQSVSYIDTGVGVLYRFQNKTRRKTRGQGSRSSMTMHNSIGLTINHITNTDESLYGFENVRVPMRFTLHAGSVIGLDFFKRGKQTLAWSPNLKFDYQNGISAVTAGLYMMYNGFYIGSFYQSEQPLDFSDTNAIIFTGGIEITMPNDNTFHIAYSYDANTTGIGTRTNGAHEVTTKFNFGDIRLSPTRKRYGKNRSMKCHLFF